METVVIITCLLLSAFFSGMETAYVSANKIYLGVEKKQASFLSKILTKLTEKPDRFITSMLVGNSIVLVVYGYFMGNVIMRWLAMPNELVVYTVLLQIFISAFIILLTADFLPKVFFQVYANRLIKIFSLPAYLFYCLFSWVSKILIHIADFIILKVLRTKGEMRQGYFSRRELGNYITEQVKGAEEQEEVDSEIQIFRNALEFSDLKAREIMTPRTEIVAVELNDSIEELKELFIETGYSKMMVYNNNLDNIVGYVHSFELFKKPLRVKDVMIPAENVPGTIFIKELLNILTRKRKSVAVVLDEYGGTSGIVTVEDIIEELFGEIEDEHDDEEELTEKELEEGKYMFSARLDVAYINEEYELNIPEHDAYSTLGGFIVYNTKEIPKTGEKIKFDNFEILIEQASNKKIELIKLVTLLQK